MTMKELENVEIEMGLIAEAITHNGKVTSLEKEWLIDFENHFVERYQIEKERELKP